MPETLPVLASTGFMVMVKASPPTQFLSAASAGLVTDRVSETDAPDFVVALMLMEIDAQFSAIAQ